MAPLFQSVFFKWLGSWAVCAKPTDFFLTFLGITGGRGDQIPTQVGRQVNPAEKHQSNSSCSIVMSRTVVMLIKQESSKQACYCVIVQTNLFSQWCYENPQVQYLCCVCSECYCEIKFRLTVVIAKKLFWL